ncbi:MAG: bifunctional 2-polyprenyl-6-hydroxyphenol methylase/3-demethylubiquinol 3-O-methyltransferase UbiG [Alphaproteobacteria bacterium]
MAAHMDKQTPRPAGSVDDGEIAKFAAMADAWWDPDGKFRPLHRLNPVRLAFIRDRACTHFGRSPTGDRPLAGLRILDIGCGGGLLAEPMCRLGATVTGIDASEAGILAARAHAAEMGLAIDYRFTTAEALAAAGERFDIVLNMEVVEHVADPDAFLETAATLVRPGGLMVAATLNRTVKALLMAKIGAEYILRWLPAGTHDWRKFLKPSELAAGLRLGGMTLQELAGIVYDPIGDRWRLDPRDLDVNYMALAAKPDA